MRTVMAEKWGQMDGLLAQRGISAAQRRIMAQAFFGGGWTCAEVLRQALNAAESPDEFVAALNEVWAELGEIRAHGLPAPAEGTDGNGKVILPGGRTK